jgi:hypothetical protein
MICVPPSQINAFTVSRMGISITDIALSDKLLLQSSFSIKIELRTLPGNKVTSAAPQANELACAGTNGQAHIQAKPASCKHAKKMIHLWRVVLIARLHLS